MMSNQVLYAIMYLIINCISVMLIIIIGLKSNGLSKMVAQRNFSKALNSQVIFFLSDTFYVLALSGLLIYNATVVISLKTVYFFSTTLMCYYWFLYFEYLQDSPLVKSRRNVRFSSVLVWIMAGLLFINLFTGILFYVDGDGMYKRGSLFLIQYILSYIYVLITCFRALLGVFPEKNHARKRTLILLALFPVVPAIAGILQFIYPQLPLACGALSLATLIMYLNWTDQMISIYPLTRLNNRNQLNYTFDMWVKEQNSDKPLYLFIIDADHFKQINDRYGHIEGDEALISIAEALRSGCTKLKSRASIARFGGDEFVILAHADEMETDTVKKSIREALEITNKEMQRPYALSVSIGVTKVNPNTSLSEVVTQADKELYVEKRNRADSL